MQLSSISLAVSRYVALTRPRGASLALDFATSQTLDPRITFTRTSNATVTGPDGSIGYAPHNLLTYSEQFDQWTASNVTVTANAVNSPTGTLTADTMDDGTTAAVSHRVLVPVTISFASGVAYTYSLYVKNLDRNFVQLAFGSAAFGATAYANFDVATGVIGTIGASATASITNVGGGWYRCALTCMATSTASDSIFVAAITSTTSVRNEVYAGSNKKLYIWGAQLNVGSLQPYYTTTVKNLLGYTQEFDNAAWPKATATVSANGAVAPDGTTTADKLIPNNGASGSYVSLSTSITNGTTYTYSVYAKAAEFTELRLLAQSTGFGSGTTHQTCVYDLTAGTASVSSGAPTVSITSVGNGWYRCRLTVTATTTGTDAAQIRIATTGNGTSGIYIWGAQLSDSASLDPYVYNPGAAPAAAAYYGPRFDYDPVTLQPKGLLIEEQRTNLLTYSERFDNVDWIKSGATTTANVIAAPDGSLTADKVVEDTSSAEHYARSSPVSCSAGTYVASVYWHISSERSLYLRVVHIGETNPTSQVVFDKSTLTLNTATGNAVSASAQNVGNGWWRISLVFSIAATRNVQHGVQLWSDTGVYTGNGTSCIYLWGAQLEAGAKESSYIPTSGAAATRAADVAVMTGANFSNWYRQDEGTLFAEYVYSATGISNLCAYSLDNGTGNETIVNATAAPNTDRVLSSTGGISQANFGNFNYTIGQVIKRAVAVKLNDAATTANGSTVATDSSYTMPAPNQLKIGAAGYFTGSRINGHIRRIAYFPRRLSNAELQSITS